MGVEVSRGVDDVADDALGVDYVGGSRGDAALLIEDAPGLAGLAPGEVAQQRELEAEFDSVGAGGEGGVDRDAQNLGARLLELAVEFLETAEFVCSTACEGEDVPGHDDGLAPVVGEGVLLAVAVHQGEVRGGLSDLDCHGSAPSLPAVARCVSGAAVRVRYRHCYKW